MPLDRGTGSAKDNRRTRPLHPVGGGTWPNPIERSNKLWQHKATSCCSWGFSYFAVGMIGTLGEMFVKYMEQGTCNEPNSIASLRFRSIFSSVIYCLELFEEHSTSLQSSVHARHFIRRVLGPGNPLDLLALKYCLPASPESPPLCYCC